MKLFHFILLSITFNQTIWSQEIVAIKNPSFEYLSSSGFLYDNVPIGWYDCGSKKFPNESPPDIYPNPDLPFGVRQKPFHGRTFLGMVVRYNNTWESVTQELMDTLKTGSTYSFSVFLSRSKRYESGTVRSPYELEDFTNPAVFVMWGGNRPCERKEILARSPAIVNHEWTEHKFTIQPKIDYRFVTIEVFYADMKNGAYNGHILIDHMSHFAKTN